MIPSKNFSLTIFDQNYQILYFSGWISTYFWFILNQWCRLQWPILIKIAREFKFLKSSLCVDDRCVPKLDTNLNLNMCWWRVNYIRVFHILQSIVFYFRLFLLPIKVFLNRPWWLSGLTRQSNVSPMLKGPEFDSPSRQF